MLEGMSIWPASWCTYEKGHKGCFVCIVSTAFHVFYYRHPLGDYSKSQGSEALAGHADQPGSQVASPHPRQPVNHQGPQLIGCANSHHVVAAAAAAALCHSTPCFDYVPLYVRTEAGCLTLLIAGGRMSLTRFLHCVCVHLAAPPAVCDGGPGPRGG